MENNKNIKIKYIIYLRKSQEAEDRQVLSLPAQKDELLKIVAENNLEVVDIYEESFSAKKPGRPKFNEMLKRIKNNEANGIISWSPNRLSRNSIDTGELIYQFDTGKLKEVRTPSQIFNDQPNDKFMLGLFCSQAKLENDNKGVDVKRGMKSKASRGWFPGAAKPGYVNDFKSEQGNKQLFPHKPNFTILQKAIRMVLSRTLSTKQAHDYLNDELGYRTPRHRKLGGKPMSLSSFYKVLSDTFYYGEYEFPKGSGDWYMGKHKPMISKDEFDLIQSILGKSSARPKKSSKISNALYGVLTCDDCGSSYSPDRKLQTICTSCKTKFSSKNRTACPKCDTEICDMKKPTHLDYLYYRCGKKKDPKCKQKAIESKELDKEIITLLNKIKISERMKDWYIKRLNEVNDNETKEKVSIRQSLHNNLNDCQKRSDNLLRTKISPQNTNGSILSDVEFAEQKKILNEEIEITRIKLKQIDIKSEKWTDLAVDTFNFACYASYHYKNGDAETKKSILIGLGANLSIRDKKPLIALPSHLEAIRKVHSITIEVSLRCEPTKISLSNKKTGSCEPVFSTSHGW